MTTTVYLHSLAALRALDAVETARRSTFTAEDLAFFKKPLSKETSK